MCLYEADRKRKMENREEKNTNAFTITSKHSYNHTSVSRIEIFGSIYRV